MNIIEYISYFLKYIHLGKIYNIINYNIINMVIYIVCILIILRMDRNKLDMLIHMR